jgi:hypothetical protein
MGRQLTVSRRQKLETRNFEYKTSVIFVYTLRPVVKNIIDISGLRLFGAGSNPERKAKLNTMNNNKRG